MGVDEKKKKGSEQYLKRHVIMTLDEARSYLNEIVAKETQGMYNTLCRRVLDISNFWECPAARGRHQAYPGGLAIHTAQMLYTSLGMVSGVFGMNIRAMIVAAVWHDIGKIHDYSGTEVENEVSSNGATTWVYEYTDHKELIGHLPKSYAMFYAEASRKAYMTSLIGDERRANTGDMDWTDVDFIGHLILAHHGRMEWGSPVEPICLEAFALHQGDMVSSQFISDY